MGGLLFLCAIHVVVAVFCCTADLLLKYHINIYIFVVVAAAWRIRGFYALLILNVGWPLAENNELKQNKKQDHI